MTKSKSFDKNPKHKALYHALMELILKDEDAMDKGVVDKLKKTKPDDADRDKDPPIGSDQRLKRRKTTKYVEPSKKVKLTDTSKGTTKSQPKSTSKSAQVEETVFEAGDTLLPQNLGEDIGKTDEPPIIKSYVELEYNMEECYKALNDQLDWNNPKSDRYPFDLNKPLPLVESRNRLIVPANYFFNNDLAYLQGGSMNKTYTTSLTKTKAAKYDLKGVEDMVPTLGSPIKVVYDKHALLGTSHWRSKIQTFYRYASNRVSKHDVYSTKRILVVTNVKVIKWYGYGHLEEIEVRRADQQLYRRRWSNLEKTWSYIMVKEIDQQLLERRFMRSLEKFVGEREYEEDLDCFIGQCDFVILCSTLSEHQSDTKVFIVTMEILPKPTSNKLCGKKNNNMWYQKTHTMGYKKAPTPLITRSRKKPNTAASKVPESGASSGGYGAVRCNGNSKGMSSSGGSRAV
nr:hypothetical protein [Tanacetum cinerariifolium]